MGNNRKKYDLEERTLKFACEIIRLCKKFLYNEINKRLVNQVIGSSNSIGANYIEANEACSMKDCLHKLRISRKESKETVYHLKCLLVANDSFKREIEEKIYECAEIRKILSSIIIKLKSKHKIA